MILNVRHGTVAEVSKVLLGQEPESAVNKIAVDELLQNWA